MNRNRERSDFMFESCTDVSDQGGCSCGQSVNEFDLQENILSRVISIGNLRLHVGRNASRKVPGLRECSMVLEAYSFSAFFSTISLVDENDLIYKAK